MIEFYQMSSAFYLIAISFLCMIYFPMWAFSLRNLYGLSSSLVERCNSAEADQNTLIKHAQTIKVRKRLILIQAILVAGVTLAHAPILIAQLMCYKPAQVYVDKSWFIFTIVGLHLPSAIWGNGFFLFLNLNLDPNKSIHNRDPLRKIENVAPTFEIFHAKISNQSEGKTNSDCSMKNDD
ncbi:hypothetical protein DFH28DRAFT_897070 [Melampsora americana]|nr:hypothetical protein DFH28DRAFT_897070 [Melampsora americana]